ncbi:MAG: dCTP deaminase [Blastocatellia bacterium]|jgi:dCTP deaminase|nr:dCTP deaminase [Blastocatellia bacterium]
MAFWSGAKLKRKLGLEKLVSDYDKDRVDCAAYTLRMGHQYYLSASEETIHKNKVELLKDGESLAIPSGQFAVLLTEETVTVPAGVIAFISIRTGLKSRGLVNVSGFHVDPGFSAPLKFAVFNAGPSTICIKQGEECFLIWYADLDQEDKENTKTPAHNKVYAKGISSSDVSGLTGAVKTISVLAAKVEQLERNQFWMRIALYTFTFVSAIVIATIVALAQEGVRSFLAKASRAVGLSI